MDHTEAITEITQSVSDLTRESGVRQIQAFNTGDPHTQAGKLWMAFTSWVETIVPKLRNLPEMMELSLMDFPFSILSGSKRLCLIPIFKFLAIHIDCLVPFLMGTLLW